MTGTVTLSIEIELGWGVAKYGNLDRLSPSRQQETDYFKRLLDVCDEHGVPISFDIVGHLLLESCDGHPESPHPSGWWDIDPETSVEQDPEFYAPDLADAIQETDVDHELCTHTFSHIECDAVSDEVIDWELTEVQKSHRQAGFSTPSSIVTPRHRPIPPQHLTEHDIHIQRTIRPDSSPSSKLELFFEIIRDSHPVQSPVIKDSVTKTYSKPFATLTSPMLSRGQTSPHPVFGATPLQLRQWWHSRLLQQSLQRAISDDSYAHYWCHLYDLANGEQFPQVESFIEEIGSRKDVDVLTMRELDAQWRSEHA